MIYDRVLNLHQVSRLILEFCILDRIGTAENSHLKKQKIHESNLAQSVDFPFLSMG